MDQYINYGIDLGTTNSCIACWDESDVRVFQNNDNMNVTPSVIHITKSGRLIVGRRAYNATVNDPENAAAEFKRLMGQKYRKSFQASGRVMTAEELSAEVLKSLLEDVRRQTGEEVRAAVVTVPAAFGTLQCEATARSARLAGLEESPLLQEPIAGAIAYGAKPGAKDQYWMVFDLGGGTLDIAVVSTRDGRLKVLEHRGNNFLGGKDIDRIIVETFFLPMLAEEYSLPNAEEEPVAYQGLFRRLSLKAEEAKIDLSTLPQTVVSLFDIGNDLNGIPIEAELTLTRGQLEERIEPLIEKCLRLAEEAIAGARIRGSDLDRILLIGGPTQTPAIRTALGSRLGSRVDYSIDPMTAVARGAALYASTIERATGLPSSKTTPSGRIAVKLSYDPVISSLECPVAGLFEESVVREVKIDAEGGFWTSGWLPVLDSHFEIPVMLQEGKQTRFWLYARDKSGQLLDVEPDEFTIRHGISVSAPPLPLTISVEVVRPDGRTELDPVFPRGTPLPIQRTVRYRSNRTLRPSEHETYLAVKLWEGDEFDDPEANTWIGNVYLGARSLRRSIPEGSEIELRIKIDTSRLVTVEAFVPWLNEHFQDDLYIPEPPDTTRLLDEILKQIEAIHDKLNNLESMFLDEGSQHTPEEVERVRSLRQWLEDIEVELPKISQDADRLAQIDNTLREMRAQLSRLGRGIAADKNETDTGEGTESLVAAAEAAVNEYGSPLEKREFALRRAELDRAMAKNDRRGMQKVAEALEELRWRVLFSQDWLWKDMFNFIQQQPDHHFLNSTEAKRWIEKGELAVREGNMDGLKEAVRRLWKLEKPSVAKQDRESALPPGLRRY